MTVRELNKAKFRGIEFDAREIGGSRGRRVVIHEFPGRDDVTSDDLGAAPEEFVLEAVIAGEGWRERYLALLDACSEPGPGEFIHPQGGAWMVVVAEPPSYTIVSVGHVTIRLRLVAVTDAQFPDVEIDAPAATRSAFDKMMDAARDAIASVWSVAGRPAVVAAEAAKAIGDRVDQVRRLVERLAPPDVVGDALAALHVLDAQVNAILSAPQDLADRWRAVFDSVSDFRLIDRIRDATQSAATESHAAAQAAGLTPTQRVAAENRRAHDALVWQAAIGAQAVATAETAWASWDEAEAAVRTLSDSALAAEAIADSGAVVSALAEVRATLAETVLVAAQRLPRLKPWVPPEVVAAREVAQRLYRDGSRGDEIASRNRAQHPGFLSAGRPLLVLME